MGNVHHTSASTFSDSVNKNATGKVNRINRKNANTSGFTAYPERLQDHRYDHRQSHFPKQPFHRLDRHFVLRCLFHIFLPSFYS